MHPVRELQSAIFYGLFFFVTTDTQGYFSAGPLLRRDQCYVCLFLLAVYQSLASQALGRAHQPFHYPIRLLQLLTGIQSNTTVPLQQDTPVEPGMCRGKDFAVRHGNAPPCRQASDKPHQD